MRTRRRVPRREQNYWQSYSDMMAALLLMFILIMAATLYQSLNTYEQKNQALMEQQKTIEEQRAQLDEQEITLRQNEEYLNSVRERLEEQKRELDETQERLTELSRLVGVKAEIIEALRRAFEDSDLHVIVDEKTGAITFDSSILFEYASSVLSEEGKTFLREFLPLYLSVLLSDEFSNLISEIIIEGHTDTTGEYIYNLNLSQDRAFSVAEYCLSGKNGILSDQEIVRLRDILTANGRAFSDPVYNADGEIDMDASRRVVFKFRVKDEEMIEGMRELLRDDDD